MANWKLKITAGNKTAFFPIEKARSAHLLSHTLLLLKFKNNQKIKGQIIRNKKIIFSV